MEGLPETQKAKKSIYLVFDYDMAGLVGTILKQEFEIENDILAIDGIVRDWWNTQLSGTLPVCLCWTVLCAFIRIGANLGFLSIPFLLTKLSMRATRVSIQRCSRADRPPTCTPERIPIHSEPA